jgi:hypothetical protein
VLFGRRRGGHAIRNPAAGHPAEVFNKETRDWFRNKLPFKGTFDERIDSAKLHELAEIRGMIMIDLRHVESELQQARDARLAADAASADVELMIDEVRHLYCEARPRLAFFIAGFDEDLDS